MRLTAFQTVDKPTHRKNARLTYVYVLILLDNLQHGFVEPKTAPQKHFCLLLSIVNALWRIVLMRFLRSLNGILAYPPTVPAVSALWYGFVPHLRRSLYGVLAFVRRRRLFLIKSSYKRTKIHFCAFGD